MKAILVNLYLDPQPFFTQCGQDMPSRLVNNTILHHTSGLFAYCSVKTDTSKVKAIMINKAIGEAALQIKQAEERIGNLRNLRENKEK